MVVKPADERKEQTFRYKNDVDGRVRSRGASDAKPRRYSALAHGDLDAKIAGEWELEENTAIGAVVSEKRIPSGDWADNGGD